MAIRTTAIINMKGGTAKTTTAINMAAILAKHYGKRVLLIDADSQCNTTEFFGRSDSAHNLATILRGPTFADYPDGAVRVGIQQTDFEGIDIIAGDDSLMDMDLSAVSSGVAEVNVLRTMVEFLNGVYDYVLIDASPLGLVIDASVISAFCDGAALIIAANEISYKFASDVRDQLKKGNCKILGVILNRVPVKTTGYYSKYYGQKYGRYGTYGNPDVESAEDIK